MASLNRVTLIGRLGGDPEVKYTPDGTPLAKFSMATEETFKDKNNQEQKHVEWHNIVAWKKLAEICGKYLTKGKQVYIEGKISSRKWTDKQNVERTSYEIVAEKMLMLGSKDDAQV
jgi:single-strand DNA-binding protein